MIKSWILCLFFAVTVSPQKESCRHVTYNVQNLNQMNNYRKNESSDKLEVNQARLQSQIATLQKNVKDLHDDITRVVAELHSMKDVHPAGNSSQEVFTTCPRGYTGHFEHSCYKFVTAEVSWLGALLGCRKDGSHLVSIESAEEDNYLQNHIKASSYLNKTKDGFFIGGSDEDQEGVWMWADSGRDIIYMNWATTEPTRTYKENCLGLWRDGGWKWGDYPCSYKIGYICEKSTSH